MSEGIIVGGWSYVIAAYGITVLGLALYVLSLIRRARNHEEESRE